MPRYRVWEEGEDRNNAVEIEADCAADAAEEYADGSDSDSTEQYFGKGAVLFVAFGSVVAKHQVTARVVFDAEEID